MCKIMLDALSPIIARNCFCAGPCDVSWESHVTPTLGWTFPAFVVCKDGGGVRMDFTHSPNIVCDIEKLEGDQL